MQATQTTDRTGGMRATARARRLAGAGALAAALALGGGLLHAAADGCERGNFFARHPGTLSGRTGIDPFDPYAPVDLGGAGSAADGLGNVRAAGQAVEAGSGWDLPPLPGRPGRPY